MYSSGGNNTYGQQEQPYTSQSAYTQNLGPSYYGTSGGRPEGISQTSGVSRLSSMLGGPQEGDLGGYRGGHAHTSAGPHYGSQYSSAYGCTAQQIPQMDAKGSMPSPLEGHRGFTSMPESPKFASSDYVSSSSTGHGLKVVHIYSDSVSDYAPGDRHQYGDRHSVYMGRDLPSEPAPRYVESVSYGHKHQTELYDRMDQPLLSRQEQMLKTQSLPSTSLDGNSRQADFLVARSNTLHRAAQDTIAYSGRMDSDPRNLSTLVGSSYGGHHTSSILGAAPQRNVDDLMYVQGSSNPGYGVGLPPGRDYGAGKSLRGTSHQSDCPSTMLVRGAHQLIIDHKDDRLAYPRELERRGMENHREYLREREKDREREKEREQERERQREREQERERERERNRERERERERRRQWILERREKERERVCKYEVGVKRERTPAKPSRERQGISLTKDGRHLRRESPRQEPQYRRHSPVKERRRDYVCKVHSSSLVEVERDYSSLDKRYPRLYVSPECSKVVVNWPKGNLKLSLYSPVSFEHDVVEDVAAAEQKESLSKLPTGDLLKSGHGSTVWNSKVILMSGLSQNALEDLSSGRSYEGRIPHFCNLLRFAVLRKNNSLMAIGGRWDATTDGGDPSTDESSLVRTVLRYAKDVANLDLQNCKNWNRFIEIHYDRVGKDGFFSHKEVTVLYVPDLSECLPSLDSWRDQWLAHKKAFFKKDRLRTPRKEKSEEKMAGIKGSDLDKDIEQEKGAKGDDLLKKEISLSGETVDVQKVEQCGNKEEGNLTEKAGEKTDENLRNKGAETGAAGNDLVKEDQQENIQMLGSKVSGKKKIVRKIVRQKVAKKKDGVETANKQDDSVDEKAGGETNINPEIPAQQDGSSDNVAAIKTFKRKKVVKKAVIGKATEKEQTNVVLEEKSLSKSEYTEDKVKCKSDGSGTVVVHDAGAKKAVKKKVIKRVPKRKAIAVDTNNNATDAGTKKDNLKVDKSFQDNNELQVKDAQNSVNDSKQSTNRRAQKNISPKRESKTANAEKQDKKIEKTADKENDKQMISHHDDHAIPKEREHLKDEKERKGRVEEDDSWGKSEKELKEKKRSDKPPQHPGLILKTKGSKDSKLQSSSLSLDSLLDYDGKSVEESTFELSLFAESIYEMLQYEMGHRLLTFLQTLRVKFVSSRNQHKRQREESSKKENVEKSSGKRSKISGTVEDVKSDKTEIDEKVTSDDTESIVKEETNPRCMTDVVTHETDGEEDPEEDPKEDPEEGEEDPEEDPKEDPEEDPEEDPKEDPKEVELVEQHDSATEKNTQVGKMGVATKGGNDTDSMKDEKETAKIALEIKPGLLEDSEKKSAKVEIKSRGTKRVDKELLQAFRFFDQNRVGYIRAEDMRLIIHNMGKFLSHRDVKELVQSAVLESNTGRDDRIFYDKLVKVSDV
ncbi:hypothetical protein ACH5RR_015617 [Cinchona calisaya]|uniref:EF-hand domain-containing protein n=1 Tax=Cinchona calisaya TaxID=153742 RepID=A0ABD2ZZ18_9GENT